MLLELKETDTMSVAEQVHRAAADKPVKTCAASIPDTYEQDGLTFCASSITRFIPLTMTPGRFTSLCTLLMTPVCPASFPARIMTASPLSSLHFPLGNIAFIAFLCGPIPAGLCEFYNSQMPSYSALNGCPPSQSC